MTNEIVSTRNMNVILAKKERALKRVTTKDIDVSVKVPKPNNNPVDTPIATTGKLADIERIKEKRHRDGVRKERNLYLKDQKKIKITESSKTIDETGTSTPSQPVPIKSDKKKPWNKMNAKERKEYQAQKKVENEKA